MPLNVVILTNDAFLCGSWVCAQRDRVPRPIADDTARHSLSSLRPSRNRSRTGIDWHGGDERSESREPALARRRTPRTSERRKGQAPPTNRRPQSAPPAGTRTRHRCRHAAVSGDFNPIHPLTTARLFGLIGRLRTGCILARTAADEPRLAPARSGCQRNSLPILLPAWSTCTAGRRARAWLRPDAGE
jgi:hypothetical protein